MGTSTVSKNKRSKAAKSALAVGLALALALGGTFAWVSFSQVANNEMRATQNPGGRLHDDFIWTVDKKNKDVYVENFGDAGEGPNIFARVQLREYFEKGAGAGPASTSTTLEKVPASADKRDNKTWQAYDFKSPDSAIHNKFALSFGGQTTYMPTFNKANAKPEDAGAEDVSLKADVNGSMRDESGKEINYSNYVDYSLPANSSKTADEVFGDGTSKKTGVTHTAAKTQDSTVLTMTEWKAQGSPVGRFWVYDDTVTDANDPNYGWFYWAQAITPGTATGLLLDNVSLTTKVGSDWYYQIDAVGEFVTADELNADAANSKYYMDTAKAKEIEKDAYDLLSNAAAIGEQAEAVKAAPTAMQNAAGSLVTLDGRQYYKLAQDGDKVMLLTKDCVTDPQYSPDAAEEAQKTKGAFGASSNQWSASDCTARTWLNTTYYESLPAFTKARMVDATYKTREQYNSENFIETTSKVFLLSEADVFGTDNSQPAASDCYTYNGQQLIPSGNVGQSVRITINSGSTAWWWLRSPGGADSSRLAIVVSNGYPGSNNYYTVVGSLRPVFWVNLAF